MEKIYLEDGIFYIENFLSNKSFDTFSKICKENESKFQFKDLQRNEFIVDPDLNTEYRDAFNEINKKIKYIFDNNMHSLIESTSIHCFPEYKENMGYDKTILFGAHSDDYGARQEHGMEEFSEPIIFFGCIYYINDDYEGGEINYPNQNIKIKPKSNFLLCHSGSDKYIHEVFQIFNKEKYTIPFFIKNNKLVNFT
jgi:hypothetical protein